MNNFKQFLQDAVFYPCSGLDVAPVKYLSTNFRCFFYADYCITRQQFAKWCASPDFYGYRASSVEDLDARSVFGHSWEEIGEIFRDTISRVHFGWSPGGAFLAAVHFERLPKVGEEHGPECFDLLFAACEAVVTYRSVFMSRGIAPRCLAYIRPGTGFGGNYRDFPEKLESALRENEAGLPEFLLYDHPVGKNDLPPFRRLADSYDPLERWEHCSQYFGLVPLTFARLRMTWIRHHPSLSRFQRFWSPFKAEL